MSYVSSSNMNTIATAIKNKIDSITSLSGTKYAHFSIDDCVFWADLTLNASTYNSAFDNPLLGAIKQIHDTYGARYTLNCFCTDENNNSIADVTDAFADEFKANKDWLKFSFHSEDITTIYGGSYEGSHVDTPEQLLASYNKFVTAIYHMTGDYDCIDRVVRLASYYGTAEHIITIRDCDCGITGLLTVEKESARDQYYFDTDTNNFMKIHAKKWDDAKQLMLIRTQWRLEKIANINTYIAEYLEAATAQNMSRYYEFYTHEPRITEGQNVINKMSTLSNWLKNNGYAFAFMQDVFKL